MLKSAFALVALLASRMAAAAPVEYVRVCSMYGANFYYLPGTDVCHNPVTGETRQQTAAGTWRSAIPNTPAQWVASPAAGCIGGTAVTLGVLDAADFANNAHDYSEAPVGTVSLATGEIVSHLMLTGGLQRMTYASGLVRFTGLDMSEVPEGLQLTRGDGFTYVTQFSGFVGEVEPGVVDIGVRAATAGLAGLMTTGSTLSLPSAPSGVDGSATVLSGFTAATVLIGSSDLCLSYRDATLTYAHLGCEDTATLQTGTLSFTPRHATPPPSLTGPVSVVAYWRSRVMAPATEGSLTVSACVRNAADDAAPCHVTPNAGANSVTITCGGSSATLASGLNGMHGINGMHGANGTNGVNGSNGAACTVSDNGNGTATMTCPDGTSALLATPASANAKSSGCNGAGEASMEAMAFAAAFLTRRRARVV